MKVEFEMIPLEASIDKAPPELVPVLFRNKKFAIGKNKKKKPSVKLLIKQCDLTYRDI